MNVIQKVEHWGDAHQAKWFAVVRIVLGLIIFSKGIALISDTGQQQDILFRNSVFGFSEMMSSVAIHLVAFAHLVGGIFIDHWPSYPFCSGYSNSDFGLCHPICQYQQWVFGIKFRIMVIGNRILSFGLVLGNGFWRIFCRPSVEKTLTTT